MIITTITTKKTTSDSVDGLWGYLVCFRPRDSQTYKKLVNSKYRMKPNNYC